MEGRNLKADATTPGVQFIVVHHDAWCPLSYGEGNTCAAGCSPVLEFVDEKTMAATMTRDFRKRAQSRADAKKKAAR